MNRVLIAGTMAFTPRVQTTEAGHAVCRFTLVVSDERNGKAFQTHVPCVAWNAVAERARALRQGDLIILDGRLGYASYARDGVEHGRLQVTCWSIHALRDLSSEAAEQSKGLAEEPASAS